MGEASMRKWMRRAADRFWREARFIQPTAPRPPEPTPTQLPAIALRMRRAHRARRSGERLTRLISGVIERRAPQIALNVRNNNALFARIGLRGQGFARG